MELPYTQIFEFTAKLKYCALMQLRTVLLIINVVSVNGMSMTSDSETIDYPSRNYIITVQMIIMYCNPRRF